MTLLLKVFANISCDTSCTWLLTNTLIWFFCRLWFTMSDWLLSAQWTWMDCQYSNYIWNVWTYNKEWREIHHSITLTCGMQLVADGLLFTVNDHKQQG